MAERARRPKSKIVTRGHTFGILRELVFVMARSGLPIAVFCSLLIMFAMLLPLSLNGNYLAQAQGGGTAYIVDESAGAGGIGDWFSCDTSTGACTSLTTGVGFGVDPCDLDVKFPAPAPVGGEVYSVNMLAVAAWGVGLVLIVGAAGFGLLWFGRRRNSQRPTP